MKRFVALLLAFLCFFCSSAFASTEYLENYYACFFDAHSLGQQTGVNMSFDTFFIELFFTNKDDTIYYAQKKWVKGRVVETDMVSADYVEHGKDFTITLPDGTSFSGYWDDGSPWLDFGAGAFKFRRVEPLNAFTEWNKQ